MENAIISGSLGIHDVGQKIEERKVRLLRHIVRRDENQITNKVRLFKVGGMAKRG